MTGRCFLKTVRLFSILLADFSKVQKSNRDTPGYFTTNCREKLVSTVLIAKFAATDTQVFSACGAKKRGWISH